MFVEALGFFVSVLATAEEEVSVSSKLCVSDALKVSETRLDAVSHGRSEVALFLLLLLQGNGVVSSVRVNLWGCPKLTGNTLH